MISFSDIFLHLPPRATARGAFLCEKAALKFRAAGKKVTQARRLSQCEFIRIGHCIGKKLTVQRAHFSIDSRASLLCKPFRGRSARPPADLTAFFSNQARVKRMMTLRGCLFGVQKGARRDHIISPTLGRACRGSQEKEQKKIPRRRPATAPCLLAADDPSGAPPSLARGRHARPVF